MLFASLGSAASGVAGSTLLSDYASLKNGSYYKLMKAYYAGKGGGDSVDSIAEKPPSVRQSASKDDSATLTRVQNATDVLKDSAAVLLEKGSQSLFQEKEFTSVDENGVKTTTKGYDVYDVDAVYKAVAGFVDAYHSVVEAASSAQSSSIATKAQSLLGSTAANKNLLGRIGITINEDHTLSLDEAAFRKADQSTVNTLFHGNGSYGYQVSVKASMMDLAAGREAEKAKTYSGSGGYSSSYSSGGIFDGYF
ncbi:MAG: hypothetical protein LBQ15_01480 [Clostridium sp.]|jgi:hypothetical protein|nr:hypothetical protein [Clostridium sp.]